MTNAIQVSGLKKSYGAREVLKGLDFCVHKGEIFSLLGINGAGKTTTLECIEGLRNYDGGSIEVNGKTATSLQSASLPEHIKAMEAVTLFSKWNKTAPDSKMLDALRIGELAGKQYYQMSTGQKQRLHLAAALTRNPDILFLDEPSAGLDVDGRVSLHELIRELKANGKTIVLASHDMAEVESLCDRIAILSGGKIAFIGTVDELNEKVGRHYLITIQTQTGARQYESDDISRTLLALLTSYREKGEKVLDIKIDRGSLEQHFMKIAKGGSI